MTQRGNEIIEINELTVEIEDWQAFDLNWDATRQEILGPGWTLKGQLYLEIRNPFDQEVGWMAEKGENPTRSDAEEFLYQPSPTTSITEMTGTVNRTFEQRSSLLRVNQSGPKDHAEILLSIKKVPILVLYSGKVRLKLPKQGEKIHLTGDLFCDVSVTSTGLASLISAEVINRWMGKDNEAHWAKVRLKLDPSLRITNSTLTHL
jgi:hypothetical protein